MSKRIRLLAAITGAVILLLTGAGAAVITLRRRRGPLRLRLGAGAASGEAFQMAQALARVVTAEHSSIALEVIETEGTRENLARLEAGELDLVTAQADVEVGSRARLVCALYPDLFQLVARDEAGIRRFADLAGKRVALPRRGSGQWASFWHVAEHYGLDGRGITVVSKSSEQAVEAIIAGEVDALFRVRSPTNAGIARVISSCAASLVPIEQGAAMRLIQPALMVAAIPKGAYKGAPPIPARDIPTIAVERMLLARRGVDPEAVSIVASILFEHRRALLRSSPLAGFIRQPRLEEGTNVPLHPGARAFYDREKPSYFVENADFLALILSVVLLIGSSAVGLRSYAQRRQKNVADHHALRLAALAREVQSCDDLAYLRAQRERLIVMLAEVIDDLDKDRLNAEGFNFFSFTWQVTLAEISRREAALTREAR